MSVPTFAQLKNWADNYVKLWNAGDRAGWAANWRALAPGEFSMLDPVGTPMKHGFQHCALDSFDLFQPTVRFRIHPGSLFIRGSEERFAYSIETYRFEPDGSVVIRTYYKVPAHSAGDLGKLFETYPPEGTAGV